MANWAHGGRTLFKSGAWAGFLSLEGKKRDVILKLTFNSGEGTFNGIGNVSVFVMICLFFIMLFFYVNSPKQRTLLLAV